MSSGSLLRSDDAGTGSGASGPRETYCKCLEPIASLTLKRGTSLLQFPVRPRAILKEGIQPGPAQPRRAIFTYSEGLKRGQGASIS